MRGLLGDDFTTVGRAGGTGWLDPEASPPPVSTPPPPPALSMVRSMPFSRQSCRLRRKRLLLLDMEGEGGGDEGTCFGASPADWVRVSSLLEDGTAREDGTVRDDDVVDAAVVVVAVDVAAAAAAAAPAGSSWLWLML